MSIFETSSLKRECLDDTLRLHCSIINTENLQGHTEYVIRVQRGPLPENSWHIYKRFNDFLSLHHSLQSSGLNLPLPPKKYLRNFDHEVISERRIGLQKYLDIVLNHPILSSTLSVKRFVDPHKYTRIHQGLTTNHLCIVLRDLNVDVIKALPQIGWRLRKQHFLVNFKSRSDTVGECILSWCEFGPDKYNDDKQILSILKSFCTLQHVNISQLELSGISEGGAWVIRKLNKNGTLLDFIYGIKNSCSSSAIKKYSNFELRKPVSPSEVIEIISQILQGLSYLHSKNIPYGHLHLGNILLFGEVVKLLDLENAILGLPSYYRSYLVEQKQLSTMQAIDVYCVGLVMYEMLFCEQLRDPFSFVIPASCPPIFKPVLESILLVDNVKKGVPTVASLLNMEIFRRSPLKPHPYLKLPTNSKNCIQIIINNTLERLKEDQMKVRISKRTLKLEEMLMTQVNKSIQTNKTKPKKSSGHEVNGINDFAIQPESPSTSSITMNSQERITPPTTMPSNEEEPAQQSPLKEESIPDTSGGKSRTALLKDIQHFRKEGLRRVNSKT